MSTYADLLNQNLTNLRGAFSTGGRPRAQMELDRLGFGGSGSAFSNNALNYLERNDPAAMVYLGSQMYGAQPTGGSAGGKILTPLGGTGTTGGAGTTGDGGPVFQPSGKYPWGREKDLLYGGNLNRAWDFLNAAGQGYQAWSQQPGNTDPNAWWQSTFVPAVQRRLDMTGSSSVGPDGIPRGPDGQPLDYLSPGFNSADILRLGAGGLGSTPPLGAPVGPGFDPTAFFGDLDRRLAGFDPFAGSGDEDFLGRINTTLDPFRGVGGALGGKITGLGESLNRQIGGGFLGLGTDIGNLGTTMGGRFNALDTSMSGLGTDLGGLRGLIGGDITGLGEDLSRQIGAGLSQVGNEVLNIGTQLTRIDVGLGASLIDIGTKLDGVGGLIDAGGADVRSAIGGDISEMGNRLTALGVSVGDLDTNLGDRLTTMGADITGLGSDLAGGIGDLGTDIGGLGRGIGSLWDLNTAGFQGLGTDIGNLGTDLGGRFSGLGTDIGGLGTDLGGRIGGLGRGIGSLWDLNTAGFQGLGTDIGNLGTDIGGLRDITKAGFGAIDFDGLVRSLKGLDIPGEFQRINDRFGALKFPDTGGQIADLQRVLLDELAKIDGGGGGVLPTPELVAPAGTNEPFSGEQIDLTPNLPEFAPIDDYSRFLQDPLMASAVSNLTAPNPYDTRRDAIVSGQMSRIDEFYDDAASKLMNRFASLGKLGQPVFREELRKLEDQRARAKGDVESQFGMQAAGAEQGLQDSRVGNLGQVLTQELGRQEQQVGQQRGLRSDALREFYDFFDRYASQYNQPIALSDEGLRLLLGGMGTALTPGQALSGAVGAGGNATSGALGAQGNLMQLLFGGG